MPSRKWKMIKFIRMFFRKTLLDRINKLPPTERITMARKYGFVIFGKDVSIEETKRLLKYYRRNTKENFIKR
jgi:hypothetical protein